MWEIIHIHANSEGRFLYQCTYLRKYPTRELGDKAGPCQGHSLPPPPLSMKILVYVVRLSKVAVACSSWNMTKFSRIIGALLLATNICVRFYVYVHDKHKF